MTDPQDLTEEITRVERVIPLLRDLGDIAIQDRYLSALRARYAALVVEEVAA